MPGRSRFGRLRPRDRSTGAKWVVDWLLGSKRHRRSAVWTLIGLWLVLARAVVPAAAADASDEAVERYRHYLVDDIGRTLASARELRDRVIADDIAEARKAWIDARVGWERSEVFTTGFVPALDDAIDAWPDAVTGFHGIEVKLFGPRRSDMHEELDALVARLGELDEQIRNIKLTPQGLYNGIARLAYEVGDSKVDGGESRVSGTSLNDMRNNVDGIELAYRTLFASPLAVADSKLADEVRDEIERLKNLVDAHDLKSIDPDQLRKATEALVVSLQIAAPKLGLDAPTLEETAK